VLRRTRRRGEDRLLAVERTVDERAEALLAALRSRRVEDEEVGALERPADLAGVRPELLDDLGVEVSSRTTSST
jgi:hypothetical protein